MPQSAVPSFWSDSLADAELLLRYALEKGLAVDVASQQAILEAGNAGENLTEDQAVKVLIALGKLSDANKPVTAASLRACSEQTKKAVHTYTLAGLFLVCFIVPFSFVSFVTSDLTASIQKDVVTANDLAVKLRAQLGAPADPATVEPRLAAVLTAAVTSPSPVKDPQAPRTDDAILITQLQQYAASVREIDGRSAKLASYLFWTNDLDPFTAQRGDVIKLHEIFELPQSLKDYAGAASHVTETYKRVRYRAQNLSYTASVLSGAMTTCVLPILYALLGTCAALARKFHDQLSMRTFIAAGDDGIRFLVAAIAGLVVGLFGTFGQSASVSPLAIAFLVGYAVEAFFVFLDNMVQSFGKATATTAPAKAN